MKLKTVLVIFIIILGYFLIVVKGWYPVAFVGWHPIFKSALDDQTSAYQRAYATGLTISKGKETATTTDNIDAGQAVDARKILEKIVREKIIAIGSESLGIDNLQAEVDRALENSLNRESREKLEKSLKVLYNWNLEELQAYYLKPKAVNETIAKHLKVSNQNFSDWFAEISGRLKVRILLPGYRWEVETAKIF